MFLEPSKAQPSRRRRNRGVTLIELIVVVVIIGISAAMATPTAVKQMRERRARETAVNISQLYVNARMRAMGRGSAVMVRYENGTFVTIESIEGAAAVARQQDACASAPGLGCLTTDWNAPANYRQVHSLTPSADMTVEAFREGSDEDAIRVCFTAGGRAFASFDGTNPTAPFTGSVEFDVQRTVEAGGLKRRVVLLSNGNARLAL